MYSTKSDVNNMYTVTHVSTAFQIKLNLSTLTHLIQGLQKEEWKPLELNAALMGADESLLPLAVIESNLWCSSLFIRTFNKVRITAQHRHTRSGSCRTHISLTLRVHQRLYKRKRQTDRQRGKTHVFNHVLLHY